ncbi:MAG: hypothetical protein IT578_11540 [Verrucomicrobiae bacterium]|nr:hypothetical protein [Verrucomicrobiae bacterium]
MPRIRHRAIAAGVLVAVLGMASRTAAAAGDVSLLVNGDFETPPRAADGLPSGWKASDFSTAGVSLVEGTRPGGKGKTCLKLQGGGNGLFSELTRLHPEASLRFTGWVNSDDPVTPKSPIYVGLAWYDAKRTPLSGGSVGGVNFLYIPMPKGTGWRPFEAIVPPKFTLGRQVIPAGAAFVEVRIFLLEYSRPVLFDDLALTQDAPSPAESSGPDGPPVRALENP